MKFVDTLIRIALSTMKPKDGLKGEQITQVFYNKKTNNCWTIYPYGLIASAPPETYILMMNLLGYSDSTIGIPFATTGRPLVEEGETVLFNLKTGATIRLAAGGDIEVSAGDANVIVNATNVIVNGNADIIGSAVLKSGGSPAAVARVGDTVNLTTGIIETGSSFVSAG